jgi:hypothetical protein
LDRASEVEAGTGNQEAEGTDSDQRSSFPLPAPPVGHREISHHLRQKPSHVSVAGRFYAGYPNSLPVISRFGCSNMNNQRKIKKKRKINKSERLLVAAFVVQTTTTQ